MYYCLFNLLVDYEIKENVLLDELKRGFICELTSYSSGDYSLGINLTTQRVNEFHEWYICLNIITCSFCFGIRF
jgi:hypothetical protein